MTFHALPLLFDEKVLSKHFAMKFDIHTLDYFLAIPALILALRFIIFKRTVLELVLHSILIIIKSGLKDFC